MKNFKLKHAFTLIELIIAITILSIIMISIFNVYSNIINANNKVKISRILQENTKNIIENIATAIREKWIDFLYYNPLTTEVLNYKDGNSILAIKWDLQYLRKKDWTIGPEICRDTDINCYLSTNNNIKLNSDDVEIKNMKFYISWTGSSSISNTNTSPKVTLIFEIAISPGKWISPDLIKESTLKIQTTINEKIYKN